MKGITKKVIQVLALVAVFGLASCTTNPVNDETGGGDAGSGSGGGNTGDGSSGGGTGGGSTVGEGYVVQLIASSSAAKAESIKNEFVGEGYKAYVSPLNSVYRVQIGPYGTQADAQRVLDQMRRR